MTILSTDQPRGQRELEIRSAWSELLRNSSSPEAVAAQQQASSSSSAGPYPRLRSVRYAQSLGVYPSSSSPSEWISSAQASRADYSRRRASYLRAPDGTLPQGIPPNEGNEVEDAPIHDLSINNPLSLDDANPWSTYSVHMATLKEILTDVVRLQPEETPSEGGGPQDEQAKAFLLQDHVQRSLSHLLFVWARRNEDVGYRQGMHELAATLYLVRSNDALPCRKPANEDRLDADVAGTLLDRSYIEHDTYTLFDKLMIHARSFYEWKSRPPILDRCERVAAQLRLCDPALYQHLQALQIEPQLYLLRWLRLLFLREFPLQASLEFWDHLLAKDPTLELLDWICVALLIRRRNKLLCDSQTDVLAALLHGQDDAAAKIPPTANTSSRSDPQVAPGIAPHHTLLLVLQAVQLRSSPTPSTGMQCVMQNTELLGLALSPPTSTVSSDSNSSQRSGGRMPGAFNRRVPNDLPPAAVALSDLAKSLYSRSDVLVSTAQRAGAIAYAAAYGPDPRSSERRDGFPDRDRLEEIERARRLKQQPQVSQEGGSTPIQSAQPRLSIKERLQAVTDVRPFGQELDRMRDQSEKMGHALDQVVDVFEQGWASRDQEEDEAEKGRKDRAALAALMTLKHVRDVLVGGGSVIFDDEAIRLIQEETEDSKEVETSTASAGSPSVERLAPTALQQPVTATSTDRDAQRTATVATPPAAVPSPPVLVHHPRPDLVATGLSRTPQATSATRDQPVSPIPSSAAAARRSPAPPTASLSSPSVDRGDPLTPPMARSKTLPPMDGSTNGTGKTGLQRQQKAQVGLDPLGVL